MTKTLETKGVTLGWMPGWFYDCFIKLLTHGKETRLRQEIIDLADILPGASVLDVGCGTGTLTILAAETALCSGGDNKNTVVMGVDPSNHLLKRAERKTKKYFEKKHINVPTANLQWKQGLAEYIPADNNTFDVVLCTFTLHHLPGDELQSKCLSEMMRVLKPRGKLLIVDFAGGHHGHDGRKKSQKIVNVDNDPAVQAIKKAHFEHVKAQKITMMGACAVLAQKQEHKKKIHTKSNFKSSKGQILASLESDLIMGEREADPKHLSKGSFLARLPTDAL